MSDRKNERKKSRIQGKLGLSFWRRGVDCRILVYLLTYLGMYLGTTLEKACSYLTT